MTTTTGCQTIGQGVLATVNRQRRRRSVRELLQAFKEVYATADEYGATFHPSYTAYARAQHAASFLIEHLAAFEEMRALTDLVEAAEDTYMPEGPPISPLTLSYFTGWASFDACVPPGLQTMGTVLLEVAQALGLDAELLHTIGLLQASRMGIYRCEGTQGSAVMLRELVSEQACTAIVPAGHRGRKGELWYARVLPPPVPGGSSEHVVFTTPYILVEPAEDEWMRYFSRTLSEASQDARLRALESHMKYGPDRAYWNEFVLEAYSSHCREAVFLVGLPDVPESRPHSEVNRR